MPRGYSVCIPSSCTEDVHARNSKGEQNEQTGGSFWELSTNIEWNEFGEVPFSLKRRRPFFLYSVSKLTRNHLFDILARDFLLTPEDENLHEKWKNFGYARCFSPGNSHKSFLASSCYPQSRCLSARDVSTCNNC